MTTPKSADEYLGWATRVVEDACLKEGDVMMSEEARGAFEDLFRPACERFTTEPSSAAQFRAGQALMFKTLSEIAKTTMQSARVNGNQAIEAQDILRGYEAYQVLAMFRTPACPPPPDLEAVKTKHAAT